MSFDLNQQAAEITTVVAAIGRLQRRDFLRFAAAGAAVTSLAGTARAALPAGVKFMSEPEAAVLTFV